VAVEEVGMKALVRSPTVLTALPLATVLALTLVLWVALAPHVSTTTVPGPRDSPIQHVVVLYQENHSFDNVQGYQCAGWTRQAHEGRTPGHEPCDGFDPAQPVPGLIDPATDGPVYLHRSGDVVEPSGHGTSAQALALADRWLQIGDCTPDQGEHCLNYFTPDQIPSFAALARQYVVSDRTFYASAVPSYGAHLEFAAATLDGFTGENPKGRHGRSRYGWGCTSARTAPWRATPWSRARQVPSCVPGRDGLLYGGGSTPVAYVPTYMDRMDAAGVSYRIYGTGWTSDRSGAADVNYCEYFTECLTTPGQHDAAVPVDSFFTDISHHALPQFSVLLPFRAASSRSQHNGTSMLAGDNYINRVVSAIAADPVLWQRTAIFVTYDDCGCQYDHESALAASLGYGLRAPMLIVSPWVKPGHTDSTTAVGIGSLLAFTEHTFGVPPLTRLDGSAYDYADSFDFTSAPRAAPPVLPHRQPIPEAERQQIAAQAAQTDRDGT
jgi:phospholipase C